jgi:uncharacterized protein YqeY
MSLKSRIGEDMKSALRARDTERLKAIRLLLAAIKQREIDERIELTDADVFAVIDKMIKQRRDSIAQFEAAHRTDLADAEKAEVATLQAYMPSALSAAEVEALIEETIHEFGAASIKDMGAIMTRMRAKVAGRADMATVSQRVKARLST